jgi:hypothetical protein
MLSDSLPLAEAPAAAAQKAAEVAAKALDTVQEAADAKQTPSAMLPKLNENEFVIQGTLCAERGRVLMSKSAFFDAALCFREAAKLFCEVQLPMYSVEDQNKLRNLYEDATRCYQQTSEKAKGQSAAIAGQLFGLLEQNNQAKELSQSTRQETQDATAAAAVTGQAKISAGVTTAAACARTEQAKSDELTADAELHAIQNKLRAAQNKSDAARATRQAATAAEAAATAAGHDSDDANQEAEARAQAAAQAHDNVVVADETELTDMFSQLLMAKSQTQMLAHGAPSTHEENTAVMEMLQLQFGNTQMI